MTKFKITDFSGLATLTRYMHVLAEVETKFMPDGTYKNYIDLEAADIPYFISFCRDVQEGLFEKITVIAKKLFYSEQERTDNEAIGKSEENADINSDIETLQSLLIGLSEIGEYLSRKTASLTEDNTFSKSELK